MTRLTHWKQIVDHRDGWVFLDRPTTGAEVEQGAGGGRGVEEAAGGSKARRYLYAPLVTQVER